MNTRSILCLAAVSLLAVASPASIAVASADTPASSSIEDTEAAALVDRTVEMMREKYVDSSLIGAVSDKLRTALAQGRYDGLDGQVLADRLSEDLFAATSDKHVYVNFEPERYQSLLEHDAEAADRERDAFLTEWARTTNHGLLEMKVLPGNVRYLKIAPLHWIEGESQTAYAQAMDFLREGDAIIIDLSQTPGGSPQAVNYVISHFLTVGTDLMTFDMGPAGLQESRVERSPDGGVITDKPVYVLVSENTGSAAEEAAMHFKHFNIATLVGETTAGAGHRNTVLPLADGYTISISVGRAIHAVTGGGWEGTGVVPDLQQASDSALPTAHRRALLDLSETNPSRAGHYRKAIASLDK